MRRAVRACDREELGQSLVVIALALVVILGALALAVDWGFGLTQRRVLQSASDAAALGAGRYLATAVIQVGGDLAFSVRGEDVWCEAKRFADANDSFAPSGAVTGFALRFGSGGDPIVWTDAVAPPDGRCPSSGGSQIVPGDTVFVRASTEMTYRSLVASVVGRPTITAAASARARLSGAAVPFAGPVWPMVRHYDAADYDLPCPPDSCDPTTVAPTTFWSANEDNVVYGSFKGLIDPSRFSTRYDPGVGQLITGWDESGSAAADPPTPLKEDQSGGPSGRGNCPAGAWDTAGNEDPQQYDKQCSIPNWFYYSFEGTLSLDRVWAADPPEGQEPPSVLPDRFVCDEGQAPDLAPSCGSPARGDWVETALSSGDLGSNISDNMRAQIQLRGFEGPFSDRIVPSGPNRGERYGKALVVVVFLWDCGEAYTKTAPEGERWDLILPPGGTDCSQVPSTGSARTPDRVHLFTAAPFTFYEGLVSRQEIRGFWGGAFGDARSCQTCPLSPLANTAFLVADD